MTTIKAAAKALAHDAELWRRVSHRLDKADVDAYWGCQVESDAWPTLSGVADLNSIYRNVFSKIEGLLSQGSDQAQEVADTLVKVGKMLESTDESVRGRLHGVWDLR